MQKINLGIIGCGGISQIAHIRAAQKAKNINLTAVCDIATDLAERIAHKFDIPSFYGEHTEMLEKAPIDAVLIATRETEHHQTAIDSMQAGKHILLEKPMAVTTEECQQIIQANQSHPVKLQLAFMKRFDPNLKVAQEFAQTKAGQQMLISTWYCDTIFHGNYVNSLIGTLQTSTQQVASTPKLNWYDWTILIHIIHHADLLRWFTGDVVAVTATRNQTKEGKIALTACLEFANGAIGSLQFYATAVMDWYEGLMLHATQGSITAQIHFPYLQRPSTVYIHDAQSTQYYSPGILTADFYQLQLEHFANTIIKDLPTTPNAQDGLKAQRLVEAICQAASQNTKIHINP